MNTVNKQDLKIEELQLDNTLSSYFKTINGESLVGNENIQLNFDQFKNFQIIKSSSEHNTHIELCISKSIDFTDSYTISSEDKPEFFYCLISHKSDDVEWKQCTEDGFSINSNNKPILIQLREILNYLGIQTNDSTILYLKYSQYWKDSSEIRHYSDQSSIVLPTNTEIGANAQDSINKKEFIDLKLNVMPNILNGSENDDNTYLSYSTCVTLIENITSDITIILQDYDINSESQSKNYRIIIQTGDSDINVTFKYSNNDGPQSFDPIKSISIEKNSKYLIEFKYGFICKYTLY